MFTVLSHTRAMIPMPPVVIHVSYGHSANDTGCVSVPLPLADAANPIPTDHALAVESYVGALQSCATALTSSCALSFHARISGRTSGCSADVKAMSRSSFTLLNGVVYLTQSTLQRLPVLTGAVAVAPNTGSDVLVRSSSSVHASVADCSLWKKLRIGRDPWRFTSPS